MRDGSVDDDAKCMASGGGGPCAALPSHLPRMPGSHLTSRSPVGPLPSSARPKGTLETLRRPTLQGFFQTRLRREQPPDVSQRACALQLQLQLPRGHAEAPARPPQTDLPNPLQAIRSAGVRGSAPGVRVRGRSPGDR